MTGNLGPRADRRDGHRGGDGLDADHPPRLADDLRAPSVLAVRAAGRRRAPTRRTAPGAGSPEWVARAPRRVWIEATAVLVVMVAGLAFLNSDLTTGNMFRDDVDSVQGQELLEAGFPAGSTPRPTSWSPTRMSARSRAALAEAPGRRRGLAPGGAGAPAKPRSPSTRILQHGRIQPHPGHPRRHARGRRRRRLGRRSHGRGARPARIGGCATTA